MRHRLIRIAVAATVMLGATASSWLTPSVTRAQAAITSNAPVWPITDPVAGPPPIPSMPPAGVETPPADVIADPVTPGANCDGWHLQTNYGDRWPIPVPRRGGSTDAAWNTPRRTSTTPARDYPMCEAVCYGAPLSCYWFTEERTDYFSWNGPAPKSCSTGSLHLDGR